MKAILEFDLPTDKNEHLLAVNGGKYYTTLFSLDTALRNQLKFGGELKTAKETMIWVRQYISEYVDLDEIE